MAELNINGEPIFVDVADDEDQFPILYSQLIQQSQDTNPEPKPGSSTENEKSTEEIRKQIQKENPAQTNDQTEATNACIKIEIRRLKCPECKRFTCETEEKMLRHIRRVHRGENPFQCYMCEYTTYNKAVFEEHVRVHQGIKPFKCKFCDYKSASKKNAKKHELRHRSDNPLKCPDCSFIGRNSKSFKAHRNRVHDIPMPVKPAADGTKEYSCKICKRTFADRHKKNNHCKNRWKCTECNYVTCSRMIYTSHLEFDHGLKTPPNKKDLPKLFQCSLCSWSSNIKPRILLHLIHHPNQSVDEEVIDITILRNFGIME